MKNADKEKFFNAMAIEMGVTDVGFVKSACFAYAKYIVRNLKEGKDVEIPDFGTFRVITIKERFKTWVGWRGNEKKLLPAVKSIRFRADYKFRQYINLG